MLISHNTRRGFPHGRLTYFLIASFGIVLPVLSFAGCESGGFPVDNTHTPVTESSYSDDSATVGSTEADDVSQILSEADMEIGRAFPLDAYALTGTQLNLIQQAEYLLESKCLAEKGFTLPPPVDQTDVPSENRLVVRFGLGILSEAQQFAYDIPPEYRDPEKELAPEALPAQYSEALTDALLGPASDRPELSSIEISGHKTSVGVGYTQNSCMGVAHNTLGISLSRSQELSMLMGSAEVIAIDLESQQRTNTDARMIQVTNDWSACMAKRGFTTPDPTEASLTYGPADKATAIAAAVADVQCKYDTDYFGVSYGLTVAYQQQLIEQQSTELEALAASNRDILDRANAAIEAG
ncbi:MAG: hypothetical protein LBI84_06130 [Propionibacteriaceae bacterium]|jgi:hypothetical protein|nr:hypothetical protein [Propionibacteriaceae bacterium]